MDCLICREDLIRTGYAVSVKCGHIFHGKCLLQWMESKNTCPVCRIEFLKDHVTALFFSNDLSQDENYKYCWDETKSNEKNNDTVVSVTTSADEPEPSRVNKKGFIIGIVLAVGLTISLLTILII
ncbi:SYVN1.2 family protein [Megaselia abdita]